ncbi:hypothetical protein SARAHDANIELLE_71 [Hafnia phage vB_HpaM_SarahDanielle]|uniref:Uncharacterized protein n=1 Tax=Hafnia phage vB_HpaM_SarahDanielle TaxID=2836113 RepID=A0AAE8BFD3_9CAUD|nr:hypothetical protein SARAHDANIELLE_71 [Hafnia phage vB_HpaM_SarahDanielle]
MAYVTAKGDVTFYIRSTGELVEGVQKLLDWQIAGLSKTATGYGTKIPTSFIVNYKGRQRRVYQNVYSNVASSYIIVDKIKVFLS